MRAELPAITAGFFGGGADEKDKITFLQCNLLGRINFESNPHRALVGSEAAKHEEATEVQVPAAKKLHLWKQPSVALWSGAESTHLRFYQDLRQPTERLFR